MEYYNKDVKNLTSSELTREFERVRYEYCIQNKQIELLGNTKEKQKLEKRHISVINEICKRDFKMSDEQINSYREYQREAKLV